MDLLGRKVVARNGASLSALEAAISETIARAAETGGEPAQLAAPLRDCWQRLITVTAALGASGDADAALANSVLYLDAFGHIVIAWMWLEQAVVAEHRTGDFYDGKRHAARYFYRYELPKTGPALDVLYRLDRTTLQMRASWF